MAVLSCLRPSLKNIPNGLFRSIQRGQPIRPFRTRKIEGKRREMNFAPKEVILETPRKGRMFPGLVKSFFFTLGFSSCAFVGAAIWQYENIKASIPHSFDEWINSNWEGLHGWENKEGDLRKAFNKWWNKLPPEQQVFWQICALNVAVCACWYHPATKQTMHRFFCSTPAALAVCWPMVFSTFSHVSSLHLFANMYILHSFSVGISHKFGKEQFWAFYLVGGIVSSLTSNIVKVSKGMIGPSVGASGAILALVGYFCTQSKDSRLGILFVPSFTFSADSGLKGLLLFDALGILFGWRFLDHAAHLGGTLFGIAYALYGQDYTWYKRKYVVKHWENLRTRLKSE